MTAPRFQPGRVYLGWQYAAAQPEPGPPPRRPVPPPAEQLNPGWLAAQRREGRLLSRPHRLAAGGGLAGLAGAILLGQAGLLNGALTGLGAVACAAVAAMGGRAIWLGQRDLRARVDAETRRVAAARAVQESQLFCWQEEHARRFREWQAQEQEYARQPRWHPVALPDQIDRVDVAGGTLAGWSALFTTLPAAALATGGEVTLLDLSEGAVGHDLVALASGMGLAPLVWVLPHDLPRLDLGMGLPAPALADVLATCVSADPAGGADLARDQSLLERMLEVLGEGAGIAQVTAALRALAEVGDPRQDVASGTLTAAQLTGITGLFGRGAAGRVVIERAWTLEARLRALERLGSDPVPLARSGLRVVALDRGADALRNAVLGTYLTVSLTHLLRGAPPGQPWRHTVCVAGAERLGGEVLDRLCHACETTRTGLVLAYRSLPAPVRERLGRGNAAVAFMRLGNADEAKVASEQIGTEHRFVLSQLTDTVGTSITRTTGDSYTSTVGISDSASGSVSASETSGRSRGRGHSRPDPAPFAPRTGTGSREVSRSRGTTTSESLTEGITASTSWGLSTSLAAGASESAGRTVQRSREFLVEAHELQRLPPSALIVSYAAPGGRQVVLADANPGILALPSATVRDLDEAQRAGPHRPAPPRVATPGPPAGSETPADRAAPAGTEAPAGSAAPASSAPAGGGPAGSAAPASSAPASSAAPAGSAPAGSAALSGAAVDAGPPAGHAERAAWNGRRASADLAAARDPAAAPVSWRDEQNRPPPNLGPPPEPLDWRSPPRRRRGRRPR